MFAGNSSRWDSGPITLFEGDAEILRVTGHQWLSQF